MVDERMNEFARDSLTIWGTQISAQVREYDTLAQDALEPSGSNYMTCAGKSVVLALHHYPEAEVHRSPEIGRPYLLPVGDMVALRDVLNFATDRGLLPRCEVVEE